jgi:integrase
MTLNRAIELAKAKRIELKQQFKQGTLKTNKNKVIQLNTLWTEYIELKKIEFSDTHIYSMDKIYHKWIGSKFGKRDITKVTNTDLQSIINKMLKSINPHTKRPYAPRTTEHIKNYIRPLYKYAISKGYTKDNPAEHLITPKYDNKMYFEISEEQLQALYKKVLEYENIMYKTIMLMLLTGRRLNEVLSLEWNDIDFKEKCIFIRFDNSKVKAKQFTIDDTIIEALQQIPQYKNGLVFRGVKTGKKINASVIRRHWKKAYTSVGIEHLRMHDTRHMLGYMMVNDGISLEMVGKALGQTTIQSTARYSNVNYQKSKEITNKFLEVCKGAIK